MTSAAFTFISVQAAPFEIETYHAELSKSERHGAVVTFTGLVREVESGGLEAIELEHYPNMTERALQSIVDEARKRWSIGGIVLVHRVGVLKLNEPIVFVGVSSAHRAEAFSAAEFIMDVLKTRAPFWKKEWINGEAHWVEAKEKDRDALSRW